MGCLRPALTPHIIIHYALSDEEIFAQGGHGHIYFGCFVCQCVERYNFTLPDPDSEEWEALSRDGDPQMLAARAAFQISHLHPECT